MKHVIQLPAVLGLAFALSACPDSQLPKTPPMVPEPKLATVQEFIAPAASRSPSLGTLTRTPL